MYFVLALQCLILLSGVLIVHPRTTLRLVMQRNKYTLYLGLAGLFSGMVITYCIKDRYEQFSRNKWVVRVLLAYLTFSWWILFAYLTAYANNVFLVSMTLSMVGATGLCITGLCLRTKLHCLHACCAQALTVFMTVWFVVYYRKRPEFWIAAVVAMCTVFLLSAYVIYMTKMLYPIYKRKDEWIYTALRVQSGPIQFIVGTYNYLNLHICGTETSN